MEKVLGALEFIIPMIGLMIYSIFIACCLAVSVMKYNEVNRTAYFKDERLIEREVPREMPARERVSGGAVLYLTEL